MVINLQDFLSTLDQLKLRFYRSRAVFSDRGEAFQVQKKLALMEWCQGEAIELSDWHGQHLHFDCPT